jgi:hypothetical protein
MRFRNFLTMVAIVMGMSLLLPAQAPAESISLDLGNGSGPTGTLISMPVNVTALDLATQTGVDAITLVFSCSDADLVFDHFTPSTPVSTWDLGPSLPAGGYVYLCPVSGTTLTTTGLLGTLYVKSSVADVYNVSFVVTGGLPTEISGGPATFNLSVDGGQATVTPEPCTMLLVAGGSLLFGGWARRKRS